MYKKFQRIRLLFGKINLFDSFRMYQPVNYNQMPHQTQKYSPPLLNAYSTTQPPQQIPPRGYGPRTQGYLEPYERIEKKQCSKCGSFMLDDDVKFFILVILLVVLIFRKNQ